jgi:hypothetical protein
MPNAIERAAAALAGSLQRVAGTELRIRRGGETSLPIKGTLTIATHEVLDADSLCMIRVRSIDWVIQSSLIAIEGKSIELRPGDEFETTDGKRYEVMPVGKRPCCEPHDAYGTMVIVHTKEITCPTPC